MKIFAFESSCDETSAAVVVDGIVRANVVSSQVKLHAEYGGVVPELAAREHLRNLLPVARAALTEAGLRAEEVDAVAATQGPGLPAALLVGFHAAQTFAFSLNKRFVGIHHHEALRITIRQRAQQKSINDAEDRGVGADAEGERHDCYHGEPAVFRQHSPAVTQVLQKLLD